MPKYLLLLLILANLVIVSGCDKKPEQAPVVPEPGTVTSEQSAPPPSAPEESTEITSEPAEIDYFPEPTTEQEAPPIPEPAPPPPTLQQLLARAALERTTLQIIYDGRYQKIDYPMGDVPSYIGVCTDLVVRSLRELDIDLQQLVHEDMKQHFDLYPNQKRWGLKAPDTNIDHRRVPNLRVFFERHGEVLPVTDRYQDYLPGDIVTWNLDHIKTHIGIVSEQAIPDRESGFLIIHNIGAGPVLEDLLFEYEITGHYRYPPAP